MYILMLSEHCRTHLVLIVKIILEPILVRNDLVRGRFFPLVLPIRRGAGHFRRAGGLLLLPFLFLLLLLSGGTTVARFSPRVLALVIVNAYHGWLWLLSLF